GSSTEAPSNPATPQSCWACRTSTEPWSAGRLSTPAISAGSSPPHPGSNPLADLPNPPDSLPVPGLALVILDGWGLAPDGPGNAISLADTPNFDRLRDRFPTTRLSAQGPDVGLPEGQMG